MSKQTDRVKSFLQAKLSSNQQWAVNALLKIYEFQTNEEKNSEQTLVWNNVGFNGTDANILSSFAGFYLRHKRLTEKQMQIIYKKMPKYWKQIYEISNKEKLMKSMSEVGTQEQLKLDVVSLSN